MLKALRVAVCFVSICFGAVTVAWGADKNGVSPEAISLPSGPGSIEGLGESFQPLLSTGTAAYGVPLALPGGVAGHTPTLSLSYNSGYGNGPAGRGWMYGPGAISRQTDKGVPRYIDSANTVDDDADGEVDEFDEIDRILGPDGEDLILVEDDIYRARLEGGFARFRRLANSWEVTLKGGTQLIYGASDESRITNDSGTRVFKWLLESIADTNGNVIEYRYATLPGSDNQKYLSEIRYGPGSSPWSDFYFVSLTYETRSDSTTDYRSGFLIKTAHRLVRVDVGIQTTAMPEQLLSGDWNSDGTPDGLIRRYELSYAAHPHWSFLSRVTQFGSDAENYLPPISFEYQLFDPPTTFSASGAVIGSSGEPNNVMDRDQVELIDLNADGLPDLLQTTIGNHVAFINQGAVTSGGSTISWQGPVEIPSDDDLASFLSVASDQVHLADMDGDGLSDIVQTTAGGDVLFFQNKGAIAFAARRFMSIGDTVPPAPFGNAEVKTADLDFDKFIDIVRSSAQGYAIWRNFGDGRYSREIRTAGASYQGQTLLFSTTGVQLADMNGDRLNDVVRVRPTGVVSAVSSGHGNFVDGIFIPIPDQVLTDGPGGQVGRAKLSDISGDGLADLVLERANSGELWFWLNLGDDSFSSRYTVTGMPVFFGVDAVTRWADLNGNGTNDLVYADSTATPRLRTIDIGVLVSGSSFTNSLINIDNGLGVRTRILYESSSQLSAKAMNDGNPWESTLPFPVTVVTRVETHTGLDLDGNSGEDVYATDYSYRDGFYDFREKEFRGFNEVVVSEIGDSTAPTLVTKHLFHTGAPDGIDNDADNEIDEVSPLGFWEDEVLKGKPLVKENLTTDGFLFDRAEMDWQVVTPLVAQNTVEVRFAELKENRSLIYEGTTTPVTIRTALDYDTYGNVVAERRFGAESIAGDERFTLTEFIHDTDRWILNRRQRVLETDALGNRVAESFSYYDGQDFVGLALGTLERGNLVREESWKSGSDYINVVRHAFDSFGNVIGAKDGNGNLREIGFDSAFQIFPISETIHVGAGNPPLVMTAAYNIGLSVMNRSIDFNGNISEYMYDNFSRPTGFIKPYDNSIFPTQSYLYSMADPANGIEYAYDSYGNLTITNSLAVASSIRTFAREVSGSASTLDTVNYVDGLGRKLASVEEGESGFIVRDAVIFNGRGTTRRAFQPYSVGNDNYVSPTSGASSELFYDAVGREARRINPLDSQGIETDILTTYAPLREVNLDELRNTMSYEKDGLGRLISVIERNSGEDYTTMFRYNAVDSLTEIVDAQNNITQTDYDGLQRKTLMNHPDRGRLSYSYDDASNIEETIDGKAQRISFTYDGANRLLSEDYHDEGLPFSANRSPDVAYHYDTSAGAIDLGDGTSSIAMNTNGMLAWVADLSGEEHLSYDERGRLSWRVKRIVDPLNSAMSPYRIKTNYDALDRMTELVYPDNDRVSYHYNNRGLPEAIGGGSSQLIVSNIDYQESGQRKRYEYGNGIVTDFGYDPRLRLTSLDTSRSTESLISFGYEYDGASNITRIDDLRPIAQVPIDDPRRNTQIFTYDDLYRLTRVDYPSIGRIDYEYDRIGNMLSKTSNIAQADNGDGVTNVGSMNYGGVLGRNNRNGRLPMDPPGPHALSSIGSGVEQRQIDYDDNGNVIFADGKSMTWDFKDRLVNLESGDVIAAYTYDYRDRRVTKRVADSMGSQGDSSWAKGTTYVDKYFEIGRHGQSTKYIFDGKERVARTSGVLDSTTQKIQFYQLHPGWNFLAVGIGAADVAAQLGIGTDVRLTDAYVWSPSSVQFEEATNSTPLPPGSLIWLYTTEAQRITIRGSYEQPGAPAIPAGEQYMSIPWPGAHTYQELEDTGLDELWVFDAAAQKWRLAISREQQFLSDYNLPIRVGEGVFIASSGQFSMPDQNLKLRPFYYHLNHLGSSSVIADANGDIVEENSYFPFGSTRASFVDGSRSRERYQFTGTELDAESNLLNMSSRYLETTYGKFLSTDAILEGQLLSKPIKDPQLLNAYSYTRNSPITMIDTEGDFPWVFLVGAIMITNAVNAPGEGDELIPQKTVLQEGAEIISGQIKIPNAKVISKSSSGAINTMSKAIKNTVNAAKRNGYISRKNAQAVRTVVNSASKKIKNALGIGTDFVNDKAREYALKTSLEKGRESSPKTTADDRSGEKPKINSNEYFEMPQLPVLEFDPSTDQGAEIRGVD